MNCFHKFAKCEMKFHKLAQRLLFISEAQTNL